MQYIINKIIQPPTVRLKRFSIRLDSPHTPNYATADALLAKLYMAKADSLEEMDVHFDEKSNEKVLRISLPPRLVALVMWSGSYAIKARS
ncbi:hypothetical protein D9758_011049 [Tetrapyrgos nigripes]|uniref:Uncharacterized protein n=1 Tax=Tetrapyrgos nigripes TaxID=182062 RepID=A0A8H5CTA0_9AGAR|nr:hypothetical protein D9758_011049 [Tetrapyrgos nigripes]